MEGFMDGFMKGLPNGFVDIFFPPNVKKALDGGGSLT
jgi:hypothetical protein